MFEIDFNSLRAVILGGELQQIPLARTPLHQGDLANVYALVGWSHLVGKVYRRPTADLNERIEAMLMQPLRDRSAVVWPADRLLAVGSYQTFVGYAMPKIENGVALPDFWQVGTRMPRLGEIQHTHRIRVARSLASAVAKVHACGQVIGSLRPDNVMVDANLKATLTACDTWQFQNRDRHFPCRRVHAAYSTPELQNDEKTPRNQGHDCFALGVILFQLLNQGAHPLTSAAAVNAAPARLRDLFQRCFQTGLRDPQQCPTAKTWETVMSQAETNMGMCSANPQHRFSAELDRCPVCGALAAPGMDESFGIRIPDAISTGTAPTDPERQPTQKEQAPTKPTHREQSIPGQPTAGRRQPIISNETPGVTLTNVDADQSKTSLRPTAKETMVQSNTETSKSSGDELTLSQVNLPDKGKKTVIPPPAKPTIITPPAGETKIVKRAGPTKLPKAPGSETKIAPRAKETQLPPRGKETMLPQPGENTDFGIEVNESHSNTFDTRKDAGSQQTGAGQGDIRVTRIPDGGKQKKQSRQHTAPQSRSNTAPTDQESQQPPRSETATAVPGGPKSVLGETKTAEVGDQLAPTKTAEVLGGPGTGLTATEAGINPGDDSLGQTLTDRGAVSPFQSGASASAGETKTEEKFDAEESGAEKTKRPRWIPIAAAVLLLAIGGIVAYVLWPPGPGPNGGNWERPEGDYIKEVGRYFHTAPWSLAKIQKDLENAAEDDRSHYRYFTFVAFHNSKEIKTDELKKHQDGFVKLIQHFSPKGKDMKGTALEDSDGMIYRIDLREWGDNGRRVWDAILKEYPYALHHGYSADSTDNLKKLKKAADYTAKETMCDVILVRADWFMVRAWDTELYGQITNRTRSNNKKADLGESLEKAAERFDADVTLEQAALEIGITAEKLKTKIEASKKLQDLGLQTLLEEKNAAIRREEWASLMDGPSLFQITAREFGFGPPYAVIR